MGKGKGDKGAWQKGDKGAMGKGKGDKNAWQKGDKGAWQKGDKRGWQKGDKDAKGKQQKGEKGSADVATLTNSVNQLVDTVKEQQEHLAAATRAVSSMAQQPAPARSAPLLAINNASTAPVEAFQAVPDEEGGHVTVTINKLIFLKESIERASSAILQCQTQFLVCARVLNSQNATLVAASQQIGEALDQLAPTITVQPGATAM